MFEADLARPIASPPSPKATADPVLPADWKTEVATVTRSGGKASPISE